jgi:hypothetical protein
LDEFLTEEENQKINLMESKSKRHMSTLSPIREAEEDDLLNLSSENR